MAEIENDPAPLAERLASVPARLAYGPEPRFPWVLGLAWVIFIAWGVRYIALNLIPAFHDWSAR